jgi:predicted transcriptional regulator
MVMSSAKRIAMPQKERRVTVRLTTQLDTALRRLAIEESNSPSSVARRLISASLAREQRTARDERG